MYTEVSLCFFACDYASVFLLVKLCFGMGDGSFWMRPRQTSSSHRGHLKFSAPSGVIRSNRHGPFVFGSWHFLPFLWSSYLLEAIKEVDTGLLFWLDPSISFVLGVLTN